MYSILAFTTHRGGGESEAANALPAGARGGHSSTDIIEQDVKSRLFRQRPELRAARQYQQQPPIAFFQTLRHRLLFRRLWHGALTNQSITCEEYTDRLEVYGIARKADS